MADQITHTKRELGFVNLTDSEEKKMKEYMECVISYNRHTNIISRNITHSQLEQLMKESTLLHPLISSVHVVDAGSGNGLVGIPLAILNHLIQVTLVETRQKKIDFLSQAKLDLNLFNVDVQHNDIQRYLSKWNNPGEVSLVARGFPRTDILLRLLRRRQIIEVVLITSFGKLKKKQKELEKFRQTLYNIPLRDEIVVVKLENVSRET